MPDINELFEMSPPFVLMAALNFLMWLIKYSFPSFPKNKIPIVCALLGMFVFPMLGRDGKVLYSISDGVIGKLAYGFILGCASVGVHQIFIQQLKKRFGIQLPGETEILIKTSEDKPTTIEVTRTESKKDEKDV